MNIAAGRRSSGSRRSPDQSDPGTVDWTDLKRKVERERSRRTSGAPPQAYGRADDGSLEDSRSRRSAATAPTRSAASGRQAAQRSSASRIDDARSRMGRSEGDTTNASFQKKTSSVWQRYQKVDSKVAGGGDGAGGASRAGSLRRSGGSASESSDSLGRGGGGMLNIRRHRDLRARAAEQQQQQQQELQQRRQSALKRSQSAPRQRMEQLLAEDERQLRQLRQEQQNLESGRRSDSSQATHSTQEKPVSILKKSNFATSATIAHSSAGAEHRGRRVRSNSFDRDHHVWGAANNGEDNIAASDKSSANLLPGEPLQSQRRSGRNPNRQSPPETRPTSFSAMAHAAADADEKHERQTAGGVLGMKKSPTRSTKVGPSMGDKLANLSSVEFENLPDSGSNTAAESYRSLAASSVYTGRSTRTALTSVSEISAQAGEEDATKRMGQRGSIGRAVTFFEDGNISTDHTNDAEVGGIADSMRSILTDLSEDRDNGSSSASGLLSRSTGLSSTRSLDVDSLTSGVGGSTITSGRTGHGSELTDFTETTKKASNTTTAKDARGPNRAVPSQIDHRRQPVRQTQSSGEQATEAPRYGGARGRAEEEAGSQSKGPSLFEVAWKYNSMPCVYLGGVHSIENSSSQDGGKSSASRMHEGMVLSARQRFNYRSTLFDLGHDDDFDEVDGSGCLVMEGPPPHSDSIGSEEQQQLWWTVRVPVWRLGAADDESVESSILPSIEIVSVDDVRKGHSIVASLLKNGQFAEAIHFLYNTIIVALRSNPEIQHEWGAKVGGDLINMSLRNIGTIELWMGRLEESSHSLYHVVNREEAESAVDGDPISSRQKPFHVASSLVLLGLSLYSLEDYEEANSALIKSLSVIDRVINGGDNYPETSSRSLDSFDDNDYIFTAGKVLNNIGATFFELGFYRSASRALHRSLLVFLSKDLECGCPPLSLEDSLEGYNPPFPSLTDLMNGLKLKSIRVSNLPIEHRFDAAITFSNLGSLLVKRGKFSAASVCLNSAEPILNKTVGEHHPVCYSTMEGQAFLNIKMHRYERALRIYEKMLEIEERRGISSTVHHLTIAKLLGKMSFAYLKMHKNRAALACLKGVLANQEAVLSPDDPSITQTRNFMSDIKARLRKERENK